MHKIELKPKTKDLLKNIDAGIQRVGQNFQQQQEQYKAAVQMLVTQKQNLLSVVVAELNISDDKNYKMDENYDLIEISEEERKQIQADPKNFSAEVKAAPKMNVAKTKPKIKKR